MTSAYMTQISEDITALSSTINTNELVTNTRNSVLNGIKGFQITPAEKAKLYANFEMQFSIAILNKVVDAVMNGGLIEKQIDSETQRAQGIVAETALKQSQKLLVDQQKQTEVQTTAKVTNEVALLAENKNLVIAQKATEEKRKIDVMAGINIKNWQAVSTYESAKFEESRRHVLIASTQFNNQIQKSKEENATINALALDGDFVISEDHLLRVKAALDGITMTPVSYTSDISGTVASVSYGV